MLPIVLAIVFAQSALGLPTVNVDFYDIGDSVAIPDNGGLINRNHTTGLLEYVDGGETPMYMHILIAPIHDLASQADEESQALSALQTIVTVGELAPGYPGDSCQAAGVINSSVGNRAGLRAAVTAFLQRVGDYIDEIVELVINPKATRYSTGPRGNCLGGGRTYRFEEAWGRILSQQVNFEPSLIVSTKASLLNEQYCAARRLYNAFNVRSNNLAAAITAASLPEVEQAAQLALGSLSEFIRTVAYGGNPVPAARAAKIALLQTVSQIDC